MIYNNIRRKTDGTFIISFKGFDFQITPDYPTAETYGVDYTFEKLNEYVKSHPDEVAAYIEPELPQPTEEERKQARIASLESEAQKLMPYIQAGIDAGVNEQKLTDILLEIETLKGNIE